MKHILLLVFLVAGTAFANVEEGSSFARMKEQISELGKIPPKDFVSKVEKYRSGIEKYIENKKRVCDGEFSTIVLKEGKEENVGTKRKLSRQEKFICLEEVKNLQILYINNMYTSRKRYLDYLHEDRIKRLAEIKDTMIEDVKKSFAPKKKRRRKKRR